MLCNLGIAMLRASSDSAHHYPGPRSIMQHATQLPLRLIVRTMNNELLGIIVG